MARAIKTTTTAEFGLTFSAVMKDESVHTEHFHVGDILTDLKYVADGEVISVTGKLTKIICSIASNYKALITKSTTKFSDLYTVKGITVDCSSQYASDVRTIAIQDLIGHDVNETDVKRVFSVAEGILNMAVKLSDESVTSIRVHEGDLLLGVEYLPETPGDTLFGNFTIGNFIYVNPTATSFGVSGFRFVNEDYPGGKVIPIEAIKACGSIPVEVTDAIAFAEAVANIGSIGQVTLVGDVVPETPVNIPEGSTVIINLNGHTLTTPVPEEEGGRSKYAIDNYGNLELSGGYVEARGIENFGTMTVSDMTIVSRDTNGGAGIWNEGTLTIKEGMVFKTLYVGSTSDNSGPGCVNNRGTLVVEAGTFESVNRRTYAICSQGDITIEPDANVTVTGAHGGLSIDGGIATINGGVYVSTEYYGLYVSNDGTNYPTDRPKVIVNGGDFKGKIYSVWVGSDVNNPVTSTVYIYGGIFRNPLMVQSNVEESAGIKVFGGQFAEKINEAYIAEGYYLTDEKNEAGFYEVVEGVKPVVEPEPEEPEGSGE